MGSCVRGSNSSYLKDSCQANKQSSLPECTDRRQAAKLLREIADSRASHECQACEVRCEVEHGGEPRFSDDNVVQV